MVENGVQMKTSSAQIEAVLKYLDEGEESLAKHLFLLLHRSGRQHCCCEGLLERISQHSVGLQHRGIITHLARHVDAALLSARLHDSWRLPSLGWHRVASLLNNNMHQQI